MAYRALCDVSASGRNRHCGLHEGVFEQIFENWPLRPRFTSAGYHSAKFGRLHTKRKFVASVQRYDF